MDEQELRKIIALDEADRVEFTVSTDDTTKFAEAVCAFANDLPNRKQPGYLLIGVDKQARISGLTVKDEFLASLGGIRDNGNIQPIPSLTIEKVSTPDGDVAVVTVQPSLLPPVRYKGRVCIRLGPRKGYATEQDERLLIEKRVSHARTFDAEPCLGATLDDLVLRLFQIEYLPQAVSHDVIIENNRPLEHQLASLRFFELANNCPTNAGVLLLGFDVRRWLPGAYVQFLRVGGTSLADPILNDRELSGDLLTVLRELNSLIDAHLVQFPVSDSALHERTVEVYPRVAVRELLMNAVMHRDYASTEPIRITWLDDRIEFQSPGSLYGEATPENFPQQTSYRNPVIAEAMKTLGYVNRYGRGVIRAQEALTRNGSPPAEYSFDARYVLATVRRRP